MHTVDISGDHVLMFKNTVNGPMVSRIEDIRSIDIHPNTFTIVIWSRGRQSVECLFVAMDYLVDFVQKVLEVNPTIQVRGYSVFK